MLKYHIQTIEVGSGGTASIEFTSIPADYTDLLLVFSARSARTGVSTDDVVVQLNSSASNQSARILWGTGSSTASLTDTQPLIGEYPTATATADTFGSYQVYIPNYTSSNAKSFSADGVGENNATLAYQSITAGLYNDTGAVTSILIKTGSASNLAQYSSATLYGIKHGTSGDVEAAADGGAITQSGGYTIHTFTSNGTFVANRDMDVEYLVVGGGGGGSGIGSGSGTFSEGGGGAGGYRSSVSGESSGGGASSEPKFRVSSGDSYQIIVGAGGTAGGPVSNYNSTPGSSSSFGSVLSVGGGNAIYFTDGAVGGSGAGGGRGQLGGAGTVGQGYSGGNGGPTTTSATTSTGGGGGGAGGAGAVGTSTGAAGGAGVASSITGTSVTRAAGGEGGPTNTDRSGSTGTVNTGNGGGGGGISAGGSADGGNGGSGVVIIRYPTPA